MLGYVPLMTALTAALLPITPVSGLTADNAQAAIEELAARPSGGDPGPVAAAAVSVDPIDGLAATDAQAALAELAARPSGGGAELPNASTIPARPARISFALPEASGPAPTDPWTIVVGQLEYAGDAPNGSQSWTQFFEMIGQRGYADENFENPLSVTVVDGVVTFETAADLRLDGAAVTHFGVSSETVHPRGDVAGDTDSNHVRVGDATLTEALASVLSNAGAIPGAPSTVTFDVGSLPPPMSWDSVGFTVGFQYHPAIDPLGGEEWPDFLLRIGGMGLTDESGENPVTVDVVGSVVTITSGARLQSNSGLFYNVLGQPLDVSPSKAIRVDTVSGAVRHGKERLSSVVDRLVARPAAADPRSVIRGLRSHDVFPLLVDNGASAGDQLNFNYQPASGPSRQSSLPITSTTTAVDVAQWLRESADLNPDGPGTEIDAELDALRAFLIWSKSGYLISIYSTQGDGAGLRALLGSLPQ